MRGEQHEQEWLQETRSAPCRRTPADARLAYSVRMPKHHLRYDTNLVSFTCATGATALPSMTTVRDLLF